MKNPETELKEIRKIMERSTRFISLSGLSGILAGVYGLVAAGLAYFWLYYPNPPFGYQSLHVNDPRVFSKLAITALLALGFSFVTAIILSYRNSCKQNIKLWNKSSKRFMAAFAFPLATGGLFIIAMLFRENYGIIAPACLIFYGLALINSSNFTLSDVKYLGILQVTIGLAASFFPGYGLLFWTFGFGVLHVAYGTLMFFKYER